MRFKAKVLGNEGVRQVELNAASADEARRVLASSGERVLDLRAVRSDFGSGSGHPAFNLRVFNQQLSSLLEAGQTVVDTIEILGKNDRREQHRAVYAVVLQSLKQGNQLSDAMAALPSVFPSLYVAMVRASETTGTVRAAVERYMRYQKQVDDIRSKLKAATTYPAVLLGVGLLVIGFLLMYVLPSFSEIYDEGAVGQGHGGFVQWWGSFVRANTLTAWCGLGLLCALLISVLLHPGLRMLAHRKLMATPWLGERVWILQMARLYRTLGMLLRSGVSVLAAMRMTQASLPAAMQEDLSAALLAVSEGKAMSRAMADSRLSTEVAERLLVAGESSGDLDDMMERIADFYDQETAEWIDTAGRLIEPVLMLGIGLIVGAIVLMLYSPIFDLANIV